MSSHDPVVSATTTPSDSASVDMPLELLDLIVHASSLEGWFLWRSVCRRWRELPWSELPPHLRRRLCIVPDEQPTILKGISNAPENDGAGGPVVLVLPGVYYESVRVLRDITLIGLGETVVQSTSWEAPLVWGGYTVRGQKVGSSNLELAACNGGAGAKIHNLTLQQRNQGQAISVYCSWGTPLIVDCRIHGTVHVAGRASGPVVRRCMIRGSRAAGLRLLDRAAGRYEHNLIVGCQAAAVRLSHNARPTLAHNRYEGNGVDEVVRGDGAWSASCDTTDMADGELQLRAAPADDDDDEVLYGEEAFDELEDASGATVLDVLHPANGEPLCAVAHMIDRCTVHEGTYRAAHSNTPLMP